MWFRYFDFMTEQKERKLTAEDLKILSLFVQYMTLPWWYLLRISPKYASNSRKLEKRFHKLPQKADLMYVNITGI